VTGVVEVEEDDDAVAGEAEVPGNTAGGCREMALVTELVRSRAQTSDSNLLT